MKKVILMFSLAALVCSFGFQVIAQDAAEMMGTFSGMEAAPHGFGSYESVPAGIADSKKENIDQMACLNMFEDFFFNGVDNRDYMCDCADYCDDFVAKWSDDLDKISKISISRSCMLLTDTCNMVQLVEDLLRRSVNKTIPSRH